MEGVPTKMDLASAPQEKKEAEVYLWCFSLYFSWLAHKYTFLILQRHLQLCVHIQENYWSPKTGGKVNLEYRVFVLLATPKLLEYRTRPPSTQKFSNVPDWPPLKTKIIVITEQILFQNSHGLSQILVLRGGQSWT